MDLNKRNSTGNGKLAVLIKRLDWPKSNIADERKDGILTGPPSNVY